MTQTRTCPECGLPLLKHGAEGLCMHCLLGAGVSDTALEQPAWEGHASLLQTGTMMLAGMQLGPYKSERKIGAGGMGDAYQASDTRLAREVAIKTCRQEFSERFQREARAIASL